MRYARRLLLVVTITIAALAASTVNSADAAGGPCSIHVPALHAQADGSGTVTGHVTGVCPFAWHSVNAIEFKDRWHILGIERHPGGAAGMYVSQSIDRDDYHGDGYWREVVKVYDSAGNLRQTIIGPVSEFSS
jgi:hypothetical protein